MTENMTEKRKLSLALILLGLGLVFTILPSHWLASNVQNAQYIRWGGVGGGFALALMVFWFTLGLAAIAIPAVIFSLTGSNRGS
jgi:hypothetical protein